MNWLPREHSTLVVPYQAEVVAEKLRRAVRHPQDLQPTAPAYLFNGVVGRQRFSISRLIRYQQNFLPIMEGRIEPTSRGSLIFVRYRLFRTALFFLIFTTLVILLVGTLFLVMKQNYVYFGVALALAVLNYTVAVANFNNQVRLSQQTLHRALQDVDISQP